MKFRIETFVNVEILQKLKVQRLGKLKNIGSVRQMMRKIFLSNKAICLTLVLSIMFAYLGLSHATAESGIG